MWARLNGRCASSLLVASILLNGCFTCTNNPSHYDTAEAVCDEGQSRACPEDAWHPWITEDCCELIQICSLNSIWLDCECLSWCGLDAEGEEDVSDPLDVPGDVPIDDEW